MFWNFVAKVAIFAAIAAAIAFIDYGMLAGLANDLTEIANAVR